MSHSWTKLSPVIFQDLRDFNSLRVKLLGITLASISPVMLKHLSILSLLLITACGRGGSDNAIRTVISGQQLESRMQSARCYSIGSNGTSFGGGLMSPLTCSLSFRTQGIHADEISFSVIDVPSVYQYYTGQWLPVDGNLISASVRLQGQSVALINGLFLFDQISNVAGGPVCGQFELNVGAGTQGLVTGNFCTDVDVGL